MAEWRIHPTLMSDHLASTAYIEVPQLFPIPPPPPRWNRELADDEVQAALSELATNRPQTNTVKVVERFVS